ncbi:MAG TPA: sialate O-acetylesterase [Phycisphaerae bacterium]|nr:sialate O-acetylesterase [Phycisphaerae bacterium]
MMGSRRWTLATGIGLATAWLHVAGSVAGADVTLPRVFGSHMVLQQQMSLPVWGWADPGEAVTVTLGDHSVRGQADDQGRWKVRLPELPAGGPHEMTVSGKNTIRLTDVLVGEVWLCSGQSNMEWPVRQADDAEKEIAAADHSRIRLFQVRNTTSGLPLADVDAEWQVCTPETIRNFSAVGYYFGRALQQQLDVPIGLINSSWGGTMIEPWTPPEGFAATPKLGEFVEVIDEANRRYAEALVPLLSPFEAWVRSARQAGSDGKPLPPMPALPAHSLNDRTRPTGLYNAMIYPLMPFGLRGAIWYQGEANRGDGMLYHEKMKALIGGWRQVWGQGDFPFYYVQLAPYRSGGDPTALPQIWEAQTATLSVPNTGMAVTVDIGNYRNIHPTNKQEVGRRLSLWALARTYGRDRIVYSGPLYESMSTEDGRIRIRFDHVGGGLTSRDGEPLNFFEIAGQDKNFSAAEAKIDGDTVVVGSEQVTRPVAVRFGWHQRAAPNLMNKEGLPASPFRTDRW